MNLGRVRSGVLLVWLILYIILTATMLPSLASAQIGSASERGADLGALVDTLSGVPTLQSASELPCVDIWERPPDVLGFDCLLTHVGKDFQISEQWDLTYQIFETRFQARQTWPILNSVLGNRYREHSAQTDVKQGAEVDPVQLIDEAASVSFDDLSGADICPSIVSFGAFLPDDFRVQWISTPEGLRDLSPPRVQPETPDRSLLREALLHSNPVKVLQETSCDDLRLPLTRALIQTAMAFGEVQLAKDLAALPFVPRRYARQALGAMGRQEEMDKAILRAADAVLEGQLSLNDPTSIEAEVSVLLNEIDRQFAIDFLLGRLWVLGLEELSLLELEDDFIAEVGLLLSQDARLLQQSYGPKEVRFFYSDFFDLLVEKQAFKLLQAIDLLVPAVLRNDFQLALAAEPLTASSPTKFEQDQEALALLIRLQEVDAVLGVWPELAPAQQRDAVLYALDQGAPEMARSLYLALSVDRLNPDFLIRLSLYYADSIEGETGQGSPLQIELEVENNT